MGVKDQFLNLGKFKLNSCSKLRFWEDKLLGTQALKFQYPNLLNTVRKKHATVAEVLSTNPLNVSFRRALVGNKLIEWRSLVSKLVHVNLNEGMDLLYGISIRMVYSHSQLSQCKHLVNNNIKFT